MAQRLLIIGIDTPAGANLALHLAGKFAVYGIPLRHAVEIQGCQQLACSWHDAAVEELFATVRPDWVIYAGAEASASWDWPCEPAELAFADSAGHPCVLLAQSAARWQVRLTVLVSDAHYCGPRLFHGEDELPSAESTAAVRIHALEAALQPFELLLVRSHVYGWSPHPANLTLAERLWQWFIHGEPLYLDPQRWATPVLAADLAPLLVRAFHRRLTGTLHLGGAERISQVEFATALATAMELPAYDLPPLLRDAENRWHETSLRSNHARRALEAPLPGVRQGLQRFAKEAADELPLRMQPTPQRAARRPIAA